jgi:hypothetical protein
MPEPAKNEALLAQLKLLGQATTPDEMQKRGVRRVVSLSFRDVSILIERAINRTLIDRTLGGTDEAETRALGAQAEKHFLAQIEELEQLADSRALLAQHRRAIEDELQTLRGELAARRGFEESRADPASWPVDAERWRELRLAVQDRLAPVFELAAAGAPPIRILVGEIMDLFAAERGASLSEVQRAADAEVQKLERRVAKLIAGLEETETALGRVAAMKGVDSGLESVYRDVQGLAAEEKAREKKLAILSKLYIANEKLQRELPRST